VGLQIIGPHFSERGMLNAAHAIEQKLSLDLIPPLAEVCR
jgi:Asp-tRNA(Asn)/Glu-tRNA(Gln) amidotransferase A subunit family amidase